MPVDDVNAVRMGEDFVRLAASADTTTGFWATNSDVVAWIIILIIVCGSFILFIFFIKYLMGSALHRIRG